jgi:hypothetical protein
VLGSVSRGCLDLPQHDAGQRPEGACAMLRSGFLQEVMGRAGESEVAYSPPKMTQPDTLAGRKIPSSADKISECQGFQTRSVDAQSISMKPQRRTS